MKDIKLPRNARFLLVRPDKIGDLLTTIPSIESLKKKYPDSFVAFLCRSYTAPLLENNPWVDLIIRVDEPKLSFFSLVKKIGAQNFDAAVHFYVDRRCALSTYCAGIPVRIGPFSKMASLLLNRRIPQNRSRVEKHEVEYNLDLVKRCGADGIPTVPKIFLTDPEKKRGKEILSSIGIDAARATAIIHPGSKGSAKDWPLENFLKLAGNIASKEGNVVLTAGEGEEFIIEEARKMAHPHIHVIEAGRLSLRELASVISQANVLIANSTGPLHIAVALGVPTVSFYPKGPRVMSAKRWGPYSNPQSNIVLSPEIETDPISSITVETAYKSAREILSMKISALLHDFSFRR